MSWLSCHLVFHREIHPSITRPSHLPTTSGTGADAAADTGEYRRIHSSGEAGNLLRAIAHNQRQRLCLAFNINSRQDCSAPGTLRAKAFAERRTRTNDRGPPVAHLPSMRILSSLAITRTGRRISQNASNRASGRKLAFWLCGRSDSMQRYLPLFQQELLRPSWCKCSAISSSMGSSIPDLLPTLRPDLAVAGRRRICSTPQHRSPAGACRGELPTDAAEGHRYLQLPRQNSLLALDYLGCDGRIDL